MKYVFIMLVLTVLLTGCAVEDLAVPQLAEDPRESFFEMKPTTLLLDEDTNRDILAYDTSGVIAYQLGSPQLDSIEVGTIILSRPNDKAAGGFLERVLKRTVNGDRLVLNTEPANLPDAFERYKWRVSGQLNTVSGRGEFGDFVVEDLGCFSMDLRRFEVQKKFETNVPGVDFVINTKLEYDLGIVTEIDYNIVLNPLNPVELNRFRIGLDSFRIKLLEVRAAFEIGGMTADPADFDVEVFTVSPRLTNLFTLPLPRFPIDPPTSLVWVQPVVTLDLRTLYKYEGKAGVLASLVQTKKVQAVATAVGTNPATFERQLPGINDFDSSFDLYVEGKFEATIGPAVTVGLAPYTRGLATIGLRAAPALRGKLEATGRIGIDDDTELSQYGNLSALVEGVVQGSAVLDAEFFGLASTRFDREFPLFEFATPLVGPYGANTGCSNFFENTYAEFICVNGTPSLRHWARSGDQIGANISGKYNVYIDNQLVAENAIMGRSDTLTASIAGGLPPGEYDVRFVRTMADNNVQVNQLCERFQTITAFACEGVNFCNGDDQVVDEENDIAYCVRNFPRARQMPDPPGIGNFFWITNNLNAKLRDGTDPLCYADERADCNIYGGLYSYEDLFGVAYGTSPNNTQGLCPDGYHVPSTSEWLRLLRATGYQGGLTGSFEITESKNEYLAATGWPNGTATNPNGFNILPGGFFTTTSNPGFTGRGEIAQFWTSSVQEGVDFTTGNPIITGPQVVTFSPLSGTPVIIASTTDVTLASCRCVKD